MPGPITGGSSFNPAVPGPIGGTTPDAGNFTTLAAGTSLQIGGGTPLTRFHSYSASLGSSNIDPGAYADISIPATGAVTTDFATVSLDAQLANGLVIASVRCEANAVVVQIFNTDLMSAHAPSNQNVYVVVMRA